MKSFYLAVLSAVSTLSAAVSIAAPEIKGELPSPLLVAATARAMLVGTDGRVLWELKKCGNIHRVWLKGNWVYFSNNNLWRVNVLTGEKEFLYSPSPKDGLFGFEILPDGNIVIAENGTGYITEFAAGTTNAIVRFRGDPRTAEGKMPGLHNRYRMIRKTRAGTYLVCCSGANAVREYDANGKLVWEQYAPRLKSGHAPLTFEALRRTNGNTIVSHLGGVTEYTSDHRAVWSFTIGDFPELKLDNLCGIQELPNGNLVVGTYANGRPDGSRVTAFEITREKKIVWSYAPTHDRNMMTAFRIEASEWPGRCE